MREMRNIGNCPECGAPIKEVRVLDGHYVVKFTCHCGVHDNRGSHYFVDASAYEYENNTYGGGE